MPISSLDDLFQALLDATTSSRVREILEEIGDYADAGIDQPFGQLGLAWHPFGDDTSNLSAIGLATKAGKSLTERVTNAFDAVLESRVQPGISLPTSPRAAA